MGLVATVNIVRPWDDGVPPTRVGTAGIALGDDTARAVERVTYRQEVERVGDVIVDDGRPVGELAPELAEVWEIVDAVWPDDLRGELAQLSVVREAPRGLVGVVHPSGTAGWILSLDLADLPDRVLIEETIVHELSHVVTLDREVFTFNQVDGCAGTAIELGCAAPDTVLADFADRFWPDGTAVGADGDFVNVYAMTAAHEDLAETFTAWTLGWPVEGPVIEAKIELLAADPQLSSLADALRTRLLARTDEPGT
ncbi:MAG: hypothetical protein RIB98_19345 [Acidimicrobiales bacterium]